MTRTFLRIKRRRTEEPLPFIRLEALNPPRRRRDAPHWYDDNKKRGRPSGDGKLADLDSDSLSDFLDPEQQHEARPHPATSSVLWKRLEPMQEEAQSCRIVDALLENSGEDDIRQNKRRKLTLLETTNSSTGKGLDLMPSSSSSTTKRKGKALKVLDPLTRLVDDSLQQVHAGTRLISEHYRFITTDTRLASSRDTKKWVLWCHSSGGNLLHACALWNDTEMAGDLLLQQNIAGPLCEASDGDGRTPYEVAQLSGHDSVCEMLEAFGGDTTNFVYDIFCLEEAAAYYDEEMAQDEKYAPTTVELTSGVAYWTPDGELMLEANGNISPYDMEDDDDGEIDSNCEDYDANDYPDEEEDDEDVAWGYEDRASGTQEHDHDFPRNNLDDPLLDHNQEPCALDGNLLRRKDIIYAAEPDGDHDSEHDTMAGGAAYGGFDRRPYATANEM